MTSVDDTQPLITHLVELRNRLLRSIIFVAVIFVALVYFSNEIYNFDYEIGRASCRERV